MFESVNIRLLIGRSQLYPLKMSITIDIDWDKPFLKVGPTPMRFIRGSDNVKLRAKLTLKNTTSFAVTYMMKGVSSGILTATDPSCGYLDAAEERVIRFTRDSVPQVPKEQFLLLTAPMTTAEVRLGSYDYWKNLPARAGRQPKFIHVEVKEIPKPTCKCCETLAVMNKRVEGLQAQLGRLKPQQQTSVAGETDESAAQLFTRLTLISICLAASLSVGNALLGWF